MTFIRNTHRLVKVMAVALALAQVRGTDRVRIAVARPHLATTTAPRASPCAGSSHRNAAALFSEFR